MHDPFPDQENDFTRRFEKERSDIETMRIFPYYPFSKLSICFPECSIPYLYSTEIARRRERERAAGIE